MFNKNCVAHVMRHRLLYRRSLPKLMYVIILIVISFAVASVTAVEYYESAYAGDQCDSDRDCNRGGKCEDPSSEYSLCVKSGVRQDGIGDTCNSTSQCTTMFGSYATDCRNSSDAFSICLCGSVNCALATGDNDDDGVNNNRDLCPETALEYHVGLEASKSVGEIGNTRGCHSSETPSLSGADADGDGVDDDVDLCPGTASGATVDADGCTVAASTPTPTPVPSGADDDRDGVDDTLDKCPDTPASTTVDAEGCPVLSDISLASNALELPLPVEPNVFVMSDDSGSMDSEMMLDGGGDFRPFASINANMFYLFGFANEYSASFSTITDISGNNHYTGVWDIVVPSQDTLDSHSDFGPNALAAWRVRNSDYNPIYYNPKVRYLPWVNFTNSVPKTAKVDPSDPLSSTVDLTTALPAFDIKGVPTGDTYTIQYDDAGGTRRSVTVFEAVTVTVRNFTPARYYTWKEDTDNDGVVDASEVEMDARGNPIPTIITPSVRVYPGGEDRTDCANPLECTYAEEMQNFANWFSYYRRREYVAKAALGRMVENRSTVRIGYASINNRSTSIRVKSMNHSTQSGNKLDLINSIYSTNSLGGTPLRSALDKTGRYFSCSVNDVFGATTATVPGDADCPILSASDGGTCQQNYAILVSDGAWNGTMSGRSVGDADADDASNPYDGFNFVDGPSTYFSTLADVAMYYYKNDIHTLANDVPTTPIDRARGGTKATAETMHQHMTTYTIGFGVDGSFNSMPASLSEPIEWGNPWSSGVRKIDDMRHAAYNGRGEYLSATKPQDLQDKMAEVMDQITAGAGVASAVSFNTQELQSGTKIFRAFFNSLLNNGDLIAQQVFTDGSINTAITWSAADKLDSATRQIITYKPDLTTPSSSAGVPFRYANLNALQQGVLTTTDVDYLRGDRSVEQPGGALRQRETNNGLLGDIVHSAPLFVGRPILPADRMSTAPYPTATSFRYSVFKENNKTRQDMVYVGANDGMMHAFDADTGVEKFAYVPNMLIDDAASSDMLNNFPQPNYVHQFYVDLTPTAGDVFFDSPAVSGPGRGWRTILIGGMGAGAKGYYALDVTKPSVFSSEASAASAVMWEFTEDDDADLGHTYSRPLIAMTNTEVTSGIKRWVALFGNGYNSRQGIAKLMALDMEGGNDKVWDSSDVLKVSTGNGPISNVPNGLSTPRGVDIDANGTIDYAYAGDLQGNLYRFDLTDTRGNWSVTKIFTAKDALGNRQPITTRPVVVRKEENSDDLIVVITTGQWMTKADATDTATQSIYGILDDGGRSFSIARSDLVEQVYSTDSYTYIDPTTSQSETIAVRTLTNNAVNYRSKDGWFIDLDVKNSSGVVEHPGEKAVRNLQVNGEFGFVASVFPHANLNCDAKGGGALLAFNLKTGGSGSSLSSGAVFDINRDGEFTSADHASGNVVAGMVFDSTPTDTAFLGDYIYGQTADQNIFTYETDPGNVDKSGRLSWRQVDDY